jgi:hypothetical protein
VASTSIGWPFGVGTCGAFTTDDADRLPGVTWYVWTSARNCFVSIGDAVHADAGGLEGLLRRGEDGQLWVVARPLEESGFRHRSDQDDVSVRGGREAEDHQDGGDRDEPALIHAWLSSSSLGAAPSSV